MNHDKDKGKLMHKPDNKIAAQINLIKLPTNTRYEFDFDKDTDWVKDILVELNENASEKSPEAYLEETYLTISGEVEKKDKPEMGEFLLVEGTVCSEYATECIRTLKPMKVELEFPFKICFVDESMAGTELFEDADETWVDGDVYELYFYNKRTVNFQEMIHEQVFLNYNQYPVLDADSKLEGVESHE